MAPTQASNYASGRYVRRPQTIGAPRSRGLSEAAAPAAREIVVDRIKAAPDTDGATRQTVEKMAEYIRRGAADPQIQAATDYALKHFAMGSDRPALKAWGIFWYVKHCVKFRVDEATMFRLGEENQQDILIAPEVLARMKDPAEDCDGFTMIEAAMLSTPQAQIPVAIATVAADPSDEKRWSHVFPIALLPSGAVPLFRGITMRGGVTPLDASHGVGPGWMVPLEHIFRWQAWDLDGRPLDLAPANFQAHGYVRVGRRGRGFGGLGQCYDSISGGEIPCPDESTPIFTGPSLSTPASSSSMNWGSFLSNLVNQAAGVAKIAVMPQGSTVLPSGQVLTPGSSSVFGYAGTSPSWLLPAGIAVGIGALLLLAKRSG